MTDDHLITLMNSAESAGGVERHASWTELFFDLVVVAGVLQLSHLPARGPDGR
ncbi:hypothetical protein ACFYUY_22330 [Kitasatospora sp. NPDC004745]|uniref:hypothetical protein n=1 Tax=Kitasatospora sp. NPDC004745 TaxID=3364019 RepID=UPI00368325B6